MAENPDTPGVILAGGKATRLGGDGKALRRLGGRPLLAHVIERFAPQCSALGLNANDGPADYARFGLPVLPDPVAGFAGPLAGVLAALDWAADRGAMSVATVAVDTPFLPADLVARLRAAAPAGRPALAASHDGAGALRRHPTAALWPVAARRAIAEALARGERRIGQLAADLGAVVVQFDWDRTDPFFNINRPEDLARAERILANG